MRSTDIVTATVEVAVDPATAFAIFTEEIGQWWRPGPINWNDTGLNADADGPPGVVPVDRARCRRPLARGVQPGHWRRLRVWPHPGVGARRSPHVLVSGRRSRHRRHRGRDSLRGHRW